MDKEETIFRNNVQEDIRPWGKFRSFPHKSASSVKIITVNPGCSLSLQYHNRRSEIWIILDEGLEATVGDRVWQPSKNEEIFISKKSVHRLRNTGKTTARILEFWLGNSTENDIVRLKDNYGRK
ncbi:MAG: phosphomannose isomerase type II C-terminal cupin domain [Candidatus Aminicenantes bacterium]|nr:phosphomannose isomerase type II C-terminal cupin domain [Candidatus Aminicenantes bacterium]